MQPVLYLVVPCYNEQEVLPVTAPIFEKQLSKMVSESLISNKSKILFVDDGSKDKTWDIITALSKKNGIFCGIRQSRNRGHQNALLSGLMEAKDKCDITISIDCDGQDDIEACEEMVKQYLDGCEVVYGVRNDRKTDTVFKRTTAKAFYKFLKFMGAEIVYNHADYRLISSRVLYELERFKEVNLFLRGIVPMVGFKSTAVYYERKERLAGKSHYPLKKMLSLALDGITSLSIKPLRMITALGILFSIISFIGVIWSFVAYFCGATITGWASTVCIVCFMGGLQLVSLGVIGEYIGKIYLETKARPRYIISEKTENSEDGK